MKPGDLVTFTPTAAWREGIAGRIGLVVAIRKRAASWAQWDCLIDGQVEENFVWYTDRPRWWKEYGVEFVPADKNRENQD
jgi:hypothetical protein